MVESFEPVRAIYGERLRENEPLARYTSARIGGPADHFVIAQSAAELAQVVRIGWGIGMPVMVLGGGSNVLVSDRGFRGMVVLNHARGTEFEVSGERVCVRAESGANLGSLARQCVARGYVGLEWAAAIPGSVGGAVVGNAGAHGGDMACVLALADILQRDGMIARWMKDALDLRYRSSILKNERDRGIVLAAELTLRRGDAEDAQARMDGFAALRKRTQPAGASMGSMFKNPPGDFAGRLIEAAGLKGARAGNAQISNLHANFFVNLGQASAADVKALLDRAQQEVWEKFGVELEREVELVGEWE